MNHPILGELDELKDGGWGLTLPLPSFQSFYERWYNEGDEREDTRGADEKAGRFWVNLPAIPANRSGPPGRQVGPSDAQVAAVEHLKANQERIARVVRQALVDQAPDVFDWVYLKESLSDGMWEMLAEPEGIMQVVELQSILLGVHDQEGQTQVGFAFHSEILEPEHGVSVIVHRDQAVVVGQWDDLMSMNRPDDEDDPSHDENA